MMIRSKAGNNMKDKPFAKQALMMQKLQISVSN
jgi:hypothetical protein